MLFLLDAYCLSPYLVFAWFIFTFLMLVCTHRTTGAFVFLFGTLDLAFLFLALHAYTGTDSLQKIGGVFGGCPSNCQQLIRVH